MRYVSRPGRTGRCRPLDRGKRHADQPRRARRPPAHGSEHVAIRLLHAARRARVAARAAGRPDRVHRVQQDAFDGTSHDDGRGWVVATRSEAMAPTWKEGSVTSWLTTADHKRIGILYIVTSFVFFGAAGVMAMLMRDPALAREFGLPDEGRLQRGRDHARDGDGLPLRRPGARRVRQLPRAAHDRREGHGLPAPQRRVLLALPPRRARAPLELPRRPGRRPSAAGPPTPPARRRSSVQDTARTSGSSASTSPASPRSSARSTSSSPSTTCALRG